MNKKIIIHTDACNIGNSNRCRISSVVQYADRTIKTVDYCAGKINQAEMVAVLKTLEQVEKDYQPVDFIIEVYTDHLPNVKFLNAVILAADGKCKEDNDKINRILTRKGLSWEDMGVILGLHGNNQLHVLWIPRKENKTADKLSKWP